MGGPAFIRGLRNPLRLRSGCFALAPASRDRVIPALPADLNRELTGIARICDQKQAYAENENPSSHKQQILILAFILYGQGTITPTTLDSEFLSMRRQEIEQAKGNIYQTTD